MAIWIGPGSNYNTAANWNPADVPDTAGETATFINNGAPTSVTISSDLPSWRLHLRCRRADIHHQP